MRAMLAKYNGRCRDCGGDIRAGDAILWSRATGAVHDGRCAVTERYEHEHDFETAQARRDDAEYRRGRAEVAEIQALTTAGSALREALYMEMERRDYDLYG